MTWLIEDFKRIVVQLRRGQTWAVIGVLAVFALLAYLVARLALRTDSVLIYLGVSANSCRDLSNGVIIFLFCGMIFFLFSAVLTLGELQRHLQFRQCGATRQARQALLWGCGWAFIAIAITASALVMFKTFCR